MVIIKLMTSMPNQHGKWALSVHDLCSSAAPGNGNLVVILSLLASHSVGCAMQAWRGWPRWAWLTVPQECQPWTWTLLKTWLFATPVKLSPAWSSVAWRWASVSFLMLWKVHLCIHGLYNTCDYWKERCLTSTLLIARLFIFALHAAWPMCAKMNNLAMRTRERFGGSILLSGLGQLEWIIQIFPILYFMSGSKV